MARRGKLWSIEEKYRPLLKRIKKLFPTVLEHIQPKRIALVGVQAKSNNFMARVYSNRPPWNLFVGDYDYVIAFYSTKFDNKPKSYRLWVMRHELAHIPPDGHEEGSKGYRKCIKHDIEDFKFLRKIYGIDLQKVKKIYKGESVELEK